jgi:hypothetical protein
MSTFRSHDPYTLASQEDRSAPRAKLSIPAFLRPSGSRAFQTVVHDLSPSGFAAIAINRLHVGTLCWLTMPELEAMEAEVIWWDNSLVGCAFHQLLNPIIHDTILAQWRGSGQPDDL